MEVVVAQLVERSILIPEVRGSYPVNSKNFYWTFTVNCFEKTKIKKKWLGMAHLFKKKFEKEEKSKILIFVYIFLTF